MPLFSIICPDFDGSISQDIYERGIESLKAQTFKDFEALIIHDGPINTRAIGKEQKEDIRFQFSQTDFRHNDFGHSLRDIGIRQATGQYIVHFNVDNLLYPNALHELNAAIFDRRPYLQGQKLAISSPDIMIFPIIMRGMTIIGERLIRLKGHEKELSILLAGCPVRRHMIDCMQLVMKRSRWLEVGGWFNKQEDGDSHMYPQFVTQFGAKYITTVLGEHW